MLKSQVSPILRSPGTGGPLRVVGNELSQTVPVLLIESFDVEI